MKKTLFLLLALAFILPKKANSQTAKEREDYINSKKDKVFVPKKNYTFSKTPGAWQIGIFGGASILVGDVQPNFFFGNDPALPGHNFGAFVSKSWTYLFSTRLKYSALVMFTNDATASTLTTNQFNYLEERSSGLNGFQPGDLFFHNSRTQGHDLNLDFVFSLGNINFHKEHSAAVFKVFPSVGLLMYQTFHDHLDANGNAYDYASVPNLNDLGVDSREEVLTSLSAMRDGKYETNAEEHTVDDERKLFGYNTKFTFGLGAGIAIRLTDYMSLDIETRQMFTQDDLLDGMQWQEPINIGLSSESRNTTLQFDSYNQTTLGLTFSLIGKNTGESKNMENPLWGGDALAKNAEEDKDAEEAKRKNAELLAKLDSANKALNDKVDDLGTQIDGLAQKNQDNEDALNGLSDNIAGMKDQPNTNNSNGGGDRNNLDDPTFRHRNGDYIFLAELEGEIDAEYYLIIGSFRIKSNAKRDVASWKKKGISTFIMKDIKSALYRVVVDYSDSHPVALDMLDEYKRDLDNDIWLIKKEK